MPRRSREIPPSAIFIVIIQIVQYTQISIPSASTHIVNQLSQSKDQIQPEK